MDDLVVRCFSALRNRFFERDSKPLPFSLPDKRNTQDDPLDVYVHRILIEELTDATCVRTPGPLVTPDMVILKPDDLPPVIGPPFKLVFSP